MNIERELSQRDDDYDSATVAILQSLPDNLTNAVLKLMNCAEISWKNIKLHSTIPECIVLDGMSTIAVGQTVPIGENDIVTITEENQQSYRQLFGFIFPIALVEHGSVDEISEYMQKVIDIQSEKLSNKDSNDSRLEVEDILDSFKSSTKVPDSDDSQLNDEQKHALMLFNKCNVSGRIH